MHHLKFYFRRAQSCYLDYLPSTSVSLDSSNACLPENSLSKGCIQEIYAPQGDLDVNRPGKKAADLNKKSGNDRRPPNEHHSVNVASTTIPHGPRVDPVGREETVKAAIVQAARTPQPAQASDHGYATGTSSKRKTGTGTHTLHGCLEKKVITNSFLPSLQLCQV